MDSSAVQIFKLQMYFKVLFESKETYLKKNN